MITINGALLYRYASDSSEAPNGVSTAWPLISPIGAPIGSLSTTCESPPLPYPPSPPAPSPCDTHDFTASSGSLYGQQIAVIEPNPTGGVSLAQGECCQLCHDNYDCGSFSFVNYFGTMYCYLFTGYTVTSNSYYYGGSGPYSTSS